MIKIAVFSSDEAYKGLSAFPSAVASMGRSYTGGGLGDRV